MKHLSTLFALALASTASAQITNGSFEQNGAFSLQGWEWTCEDPQPMMDVPAGGGVWSAWKRSGHAKGCFPNELYQRLPNVQYGIPYQLSGWVKCPVGEFSVCLGGSLLFGTISNGQFTFAQNATSTDTAWTYLTVEHVFDPGVGDTAIVVLNSGFIGGPIDPLPAGFDQVSLDIAEGVPERVPLHVSLFPDATGDVLHVGSNNRIVSIQVIDLRGRTLLDRDGNSTTEHVNISTLSSGEYVVRVVTEDGAGAARFLKH